MSDPTTEKPRPPSVPGSERRDFFNEAMREMLRPFASLIERRITPILAALEQIPEQAERLASGNFGILDQPQSWLSPSLPPRIPEHCLRPPGAAPSNQFESLCTRCGKCVEVCPAGAIKLDSGGFVAGGLPYIVTDTQPCVVCDSLACMQSCPTGALKLVDRREIDMGTAVVDHHQCLRDQNEPCTLCLDICPLDDNPTALFLSADTGQVRVRKTLCIGCGLCESRCPTDPRAITVIPYSPPVDPIVA
ncbi:MAG: 4Fe-4S dicluster domain-containing protein [Phycisphaerales bacterium]|nr:4Fe-4S dicluster domain-containing protein [Phycisphaerales bacterium]